MRVAPPQVIVLNVQLLNVFGQSVEQIPETMGGDGIHFRGGHSRRRPCADSLSASSNKKSNLPAEESRSICASQRDWSSSRNHWARSRNSSGGKLLMAASISSTRSILGVYHHLPAPFTHSGPSNLNHLTSQSRAPLPPACPNTPRYAYPSAGAPDAGSNTCAPTPDASGGSR